MADERLKAFYELFDRRRSVREFAATPVGEDVLQRLLTALNRAQSAANRQPWHFIVTRAGQRDALDPAFTKECFRKAPLVIVACAEPAQAWTRKIDQVNYSWVDVTIAITEMIAVATAEGLGTCWIASLDPGQVRGALGIPDRIEVVGMIAIGYPTEELVWQEKSRKPLAEIIHDGKW